PRGPNSTDEFVGLLRNKIGDQHSIDAGIAKLLAERFESKREQRIQITKQHNRDFALLPNAPHNRKAISRTYLVSERAFGSSLNHRSVRHRIGERHSEFDDVG